MDKKIFFLIEIGYILIDLNWIFPMKSSEFIKSLNFGSNLKKNIEEKPKNINFSHTN